MYWARSGASPSRDAGDSVTGPSSTFEYTTLGMGTMRLRAILLEIAPRLHPASCPAGRLSNEKALHLEGFFE